MAQKPYGLHVKNGVPTERDLEFISSVVHRFLTYKDQARLEALKQVYELPDGGLAIVQEAADVFRVIVDKVPKNTAPHMVQDGLVKKYIPMFFSGVITRAALLEGQTVSVKLTEQCRNRIFKNTAINVAKEISLERLSIAQSEDFPEFLNRDQNSNTTRTQYAVHNHAWYGGTMGQIMQLVGGYGKQDFAILPEDDIERAQIKLPQNVLDTLWGKYKNIRLPGYEGVPPIDGKFIYDYKWDKTHAVSFDIGGRPWLVEVSDAVYVMPLPIIPLTADPAFRLYVEDELKDSEILKVLDTFGAMPSGESFPKDRDDFNRWLRAGVIIKVCEVGQFPLHLPMFKACGWSFNLLGSNAYNTGYYYDDVTGLIFCNTFKLSLHLTTSPLHYGTESVNVQDGDLTGYEQQRLASYITEINRWLENAETVLKNTIAYKLRRISQAELLARADAINYEVEVQYWDNYSCTPIAQHKGNINIVYGGWLYHPAKYENQPQIKFPDLEMGICRSFNFSPALLGWKVLCDTIMYAYYEGDSLKVVKYFFDGIAYKKEVDTNYEDCMIVGNWYSNETEGFTNLTGNFYTTDIDERDESHQTITRTTIKGTDKGFDKKPFFAFDALFWRTGTLWRNRYYSYLVKTKTTVDATFDIGVLIPLCNRFTVLHARKDIFGTEYYSESFDLLSVRDPTSYRYWTHDRIFAFIGSLDVQKGEPVPTDGSPVWVEIENYEPGGCSDFADQGSWIPGLPYDYTSLIHPDRMAWRLQGGGGPPSLVPYSINRTTANKPDGGNLKWMAQDDVVFAQNTLPNERYFLASPDQFGGTIRRTSSKVSFGDSEYVNIDEVDDRGVYKAVGKCSLVNSRSTYHFIGVINE